MNKACRFLLALMVLILPVACEDLDEPCPATIAIDIYAPEDEETVKSTSNLLLNVGAASDTALSSMSVSIRDENSTVIYSRTLKGNGKWSLGHVNSIELEMTNKRVTYYIDVSATSVMGNTASKTQVFYAQY